MKPAIGRAVAAWLPSPLLGWLRRARNALLLAYERRRYRFTYSREFYEEGYHQKLGEQTASSLEYWEAHGYRDRLMRVCDALDRHLTFGRHTRYLEIACMYGKTAFWLAERYPQLDVWAFDFSERFVQATLAVNPIGDRLTVWRGDVTDIRLDAQRFPAFFDFATCLDVTEHLPDAVYKQMLAELARVIRPAGHLLLMQGNTIAVEHIHVLPEDELVRDVERAGFDLVEALPERHYLFRRAQT
jgi:SAM-dependent methyltransferase